MAKLRSQWTAIRGTQRQPPGVGLGEVLHWATDRRAAKRLAAGLAWQPEQTRTPVEVVGEEPAAGRRTRRPNAFPAQVPEGLLSIAWYFECRCGISLIRTLTVFVAHPGRRG